jgi:DNA modification methylase
MRLSFARARQRLTASWRRAASCPPTPGDTIVATNGAEKTGYPTQKPLGGVNRIVTASSNPGDLVLDFFAGSGTVGESCLKLGRRFMLIDNNPESIEVMKKRFDGNEPIDWITSNRLVIQSMV